MDLLLWLVVFVSFGDEEHCDVILIVRYHILSLIEIKHEQD
uniref:Uncharacterized protein n=1 Tax=Arundo donax TaxID=35708 RepID=A0A0A9HKM5_ARUDO